MWKRAYAHVPHDSRGKKLLKRKKNADVEKRKGTWGTGWEDKKGREGRLEVEGGEREGAT